MVARNRPGRLLRAFLTAGPARSRSFRALWAGQAISELGNAVAFAAMPLLAVFVVRVTPEQMGAVVIAQFIPLLVMPIPAGVLVDRFDRRRLMIFADLARGLVTAALAIAVAAGALTFAWLALFAALRSALSVVFDVAYEPFMTEVVEPEERLDGYQRLAVTSSAAFVAGPSLGGILFAAAGAVVTVVIDAVSFLASAVSLCFVGRRPSWTPAETAKREGTPSPFDGLRVIAGDGVLLALALASALVSIAFGISSVIMPLFAIRSLGLDAAGFGILSSVSAIGLVVGASLTSSLNARLGAGRVVALSAAGCALAYAVIAGSWPGVGLALFVVGRFLSASATTIGDVTMANLRQARVSDEIRGRTTRPSS